ncbi:hypothetical protein D3C72_1882530 [compost metagenome]
MVVRAGDADGAPGLVAQRAQRLDLGGDLLEQGRDGQHELFARVGGRHVARGARQQAHAQPFFQSADGMAERGRGDAQPGGGLGKAAFPRHGEEGLQIVDFGLAHC